MSSHDKNTPTMIAANAKSVIKASEILKSGGLVAIPTETVYGLAARADREDAVQKIYEAKGRPPVNPLIIHVIDIKQAKEYAVFDERSETLAKMFWPGPLTLVLPLREDSQLANAVTSGLDTVAIRSPSHPVAREVIDKTGLPLAAPRANKSGTLSPTRALDVSVSLGDDVDMILADSGVSVGLESTIIDLSTGTPTILREGALAEEDLSPYIGQIEISTKAHSKTPKAPGQMFRHYAPDLPLRLNAVDVKKDEALLAFGSPKFMGVEGGGFARDLPENAFRNLSEEGDLSEAAKNFYAMLHDLDKSGKKGIAVMAIPPIGIGRAINDRLQRAAEKEAEKN